MGMNPDTNEFEQLHEETDEEREARLAREAEMQSKLSQLLQSQTQEDTVKYTPRKLIRPDGSPVPEHWSVFKIGEEIVIKNYTFKVAYIGETAILFEPVGPVIVGEDKTAR